MTARSLLFCAAAAAVSLAGCNAGQSSTTTQETNRNGRTLALVLAVPPTSDSTGLTASAVISASDMDTIRQNLRVDGTSVIGHLEGIPHGTGRHLTITIRDRDSIRFDGDADIDIDETGAVEDDIVLHSKHGSNVIHGDVQDDDDREIDTVMPVRSESPFTVDSGTIFYCNFNGSAADSVSGALAELSGIGYACGLVNRGIGFMDYDGIKSICRFPDADGFDMRTGTMEALVRPIAPGSDFAHIIDKSWQYGMTLKNGKVALHFGSIWWYTDVTLPLRSWSYVCGSFDGETIRLYINGTLVESAPYNAGGFDATYDLGIGNAAAASHDVTFRGIIDEIRISTTVRTAESIKELGTAISSLKRFR